MPQYYRRRYATATTLNFVLYEIDGVDFKVDAAHASGDTKIMKDEGAEGNTGSGFVDEGQGYSIALTAAEMTAARIVVYVVDQSTKVWLDTALIIETEGNQSAQHKLLGYNGWITTVTVTNQQEMVFADGPDDNNALLDHVVQFEDTDGSLSRPILFTSWTGATLTGTWASNPTFTVVTGDTAYIMPVAPADSTATVVTSIWAALRSANNTSDSFGAGVLVEDLNTAAKASVNAEVDRALDDRAAPQIKKNTALPNFQFVMLNSAGRSVSGQTITAERSIDGAAFEPMTNTATSLSDGVYTIDLTAVDLNGDVVTLKFTSSSAEPTILTIVTQSN